MPCVTALAADPHRCHNACMAAKRKKKKKKTLDLNEFAASILEEVTGESVEPEPEADDKPKKDPAAVALGRKGGLKGGKARAKKLGKKKLSEAARKAALARWARRRGSESQ